MSEPRANDKWQRMFDDVLVDPLRRERLAAALQMEIGGASTAAALGQELLASGEQVTRHDERVLGMLDRDHQPLMRAFRDTVIFACRNVTSVSRFEVRFGYPTEAPDVPADRVSIVATTSHGLVACELKLPAEILPNRLRQQASVANV